MAFLSADVILGISNPLLVDTMSSAAEVLGERVPMPALPLVGKVLVCG